MNIAVCDDNSIFVDEIVSIIVNTYGSEHTVFPFTNPQALISHIEDYSENCDCIDIVITDIAMPGLDGVNMAKELKPFFPRLQFIFVTNYTEYIQEVFAVEPIHYILKPINKSKLQEAIDRAIEKTEASNRNAIFISSKNKMLRIRYDETKYVESDRRTIIVHELRRNTDILMKLDDFQKNVPPFFIRVHKSYLVNMNMIRSISNNRVELLTGETIPVAKAKYPTIKKEIIDYFSGMEVHQ